MKHNKLTLLFPTILIALLIGAFAVQVSSAPAVLKLTVWWRPKTYLMWNPTPDPWRAVVGFRVWPHRNATDIDPSTILLEGKYRPESAPSPIFGGLLLVVPFDGMDVLEALMTKVPHMTPGQYLVELEITGRLYDRTPFRGSGVISLFAWYP